MKTLPFAMTLILAVLPPSLAVAQSSDRGTYTAPQRRRSTTIVVREPTIEQPISELFLTDPPMKEEEIELGPGELAPQEPGLLEFWEGDLTAACACGSCGSGGVCRTGCLIPCPRISFNNIEWTMGVNGFTGPGNRGQSGSFGFYEGANWGAQLPCIGCGELGAQLGVRFVQSNLSGAAFTTNQRDQFFATGGIFRRVDWGLQGGVVVDYMHDNWYAEVDLVQLRGELSWVYPNCHEIGSFFTAATQTDQVVSIINGAPVPETFEGTDQYAFFYRRLNDLGNWRLFAGFTSESDGLLGGDFQWAANECWALEGGFSYLIPEESTAAGGFVEESWNVGLGLVWYPGSRCSSGQDYYRPLFNVADNGSFFMDRR
ncbi:MAG: DUF6666 family protein [Pirellulaceae bacterium]